MSTSQKPYEERRRSVRISPKGSVILRAGEHVEHGRLANISTGGLLAITADCFAAISVGDEVGVELRLDDARAAWLQLTGQVSRLDGCEIALALATSSPLLARLLEDRANASDEHRRVRTVVLVDATAERRASIAEAFRASGCSVVEVSTPLEAIVRLGESQFEPEMIAIADSLPSSISEDLRVFVEREHPNAKLVTIGDDLLVPAGSICWLSPSESAELLARVRELLSR